MNKTLRVILISSLVTFIFGCSAPQYDTSTPEGAFGLAQKFDNDERWEEAIRRYKEVKNKFPYSNFATKAELAIADAYFKQESFGEAQVAYQAFRELHPKHAQIDYVMYRIGLSYFNQLPSTIDRDLTLAHDTIASFDDLLKEFPRTEYRAEALEKREKSLRMLAEKEEYIADFYFKRKIYDSALLRYEGLLKVYPQVANLSRSYARLAIAAHKVGDSVKAQKFAKIMSQNHADSEDFKLMQKELSK